MKNGQPLSNIAQISQTYSRSRWPRAPHTDPLDYSGSYRRDRRCKVSLCQTHNCRSTPKFQPQVSPEALNSWHLDKTNHLVTSCCYSLTWETLGPCLRYIPATTRKTCDVELPKLPVPLKVCVFSLAAVASASIELHGEPIPVQGQVEAAWGLQHRY